MPNARIAHLLSVVAVLSAGAVDGVAQAPYFSATGPPNTVYVGAIQPSSYSLTSDSLTSDVSQCSCYSATCSTPLTCETGSVCNCSQCKAKKKGTASPCAKSHKSLFYDNDFSYLKDPCYDGCCLGDSLKGMSLGKLGTLDIGGQYRLRYHHERGMGQVAGTTRFQATDNNFALTRVRTYANWQMCDDVRVYVEGIYADVHADAQYVPRDIDVNYGDLLNAFVEFQLSDSISARVGRQELLYGAERTVSPLDWANTRRTFDGAKLMYREGDWAIDGFYTNFVPVVDNRFDVADSDRPFYGMYGVYSGLSDCNIDFYYLGFDDNRITPGSPQSDFSLHTFGGRVSGSKESWLYDCEGAYQTGRQSGLGQDQSAGFITGGIGRKLDLAWSPTVWFYYDYASGNTPGGDFNRYNQLFPLAHKYLGFIDATQRANVESPNLLITMSPTEKIKLLCWYYHFMAAEGSDFVPSIGGTPAQNGSTDWGDELDLILSYNIAPRMDILFGYSHFWAGNKIVPAGGSVDADFFYTQFTVDF